MTWETTGTSVRQMPRDHLKGGRQATPKQPLKIVNHLGQTETLTPGKSRLATSHVLVRQRPELFKPAWTGKGRDEWTALELERLELQNMLTRTDAGGTRAEPRRRFRLPTPARGGYRLP
jgi:hypothetical protein